MNIRSDGSNHTSLVVYLRFYVSPWSGRVGDGCVHLYSLHLTNTTFCQTCRGMWIATSCRSLSALGSAHQTLTADIPVSPTRLSAVGHMQLFHRAWAIHYISAILDRSWEILVSFSLCIYALLGATRHVPIFGIMGFLVRAYGVKLKNGWRSNWLHR